MSEVAAINNASKGCKLSASKVAYLGNEIVRDVKTEKLSHCVQDKIGNTYLNTYYVATSDRLCDSALVRFQTILLDDGKCSSV